jgi:hypothetical protein
VLAMVGNALATGALESLIVADGRPAAGVLVVGRHVADCGMKPTVL